MTFLSLFSPLASICILIIEKWMHSGPEQLSIESIVLGHWLVHSPAPLTHLLLRTARFAHSFVCLLAHSLTAEHVGKLMIRCLKIRQFRTTVKWLLYRMPTLLLPPGRAGLSGWLFVAASRSPPLRRSSEPSDSFGGAAAYRGIGRQRNIRR